jgi:hypothetical protein
MDRETAGPHRGKAFQRGGDPILVAETIEGDLDIRTAARAIRSLTEASFGTERK